MQYKHDAGRRKQAKWNSTLVATELKIPCVGEKKEEKKEEKKQRGGFVHTHTHTHIYIYIYTYTQAQTNDFKLKPGQEHRNGWGDILQQGGEVNYILINQFLI